MLTNERKNWRNLGLGLFAGLLAWVLMLSGATATLELALLDSQFVLKQFFESTQSVDKSQLVIIGIDSESLARLGPWPWPRSYHADVITKLAEAGAEVIGFDLIFAEPSQNAEQDQALATSLTEAGVPVVLPVALEAVQRRGLLFPNELWPKGPETISLKTATYPLPQLRSSVHLGHIAALPDRDGILRRMNSEIAGIPAFSVTVAREAEVEEDQLARIPASFLVQMRSDYRVIPYYDILNDDYDPEMFTGKIVLIGSVAPGLKADFFPTSLRLSGYLPGVFFQAGAVQTILNHRFITEFPGFGWGALFLSLASGGVGGMLFGGRRPLLAIVLLIFSLVVSFLLAVITLADQVWLQVVSTLMLPLSLAFVGQILHGQWSAERSREAIRKTFGRYLPTSVVEELVRHPELAAPGGAEREVTVFFADIRGFTSYAQRVSPQEVVSTVNKIFSDIVPVVEKHGGIVDKFLGDGVMAVFGVPLPLMDPDEAAVRAALEILTANSEDITGLTLGIGLASGVVVAGNIGSAQRLSYTVVGTPVNIAARLEGLAGPGELLITPETKDKLRPELANLFEIGPEVRLKGFSGETKVYSYQEGTHEQNADTSL